MPSCTFNSSSYCICFSLTLKHMRLQAAHQYAKPFGTIMCIVCCIFRGSMHILYVYICIDIYVPLYQKLILAENCQKEQ
uniref:Uncharacterized protein n=1 Tax=Rhipicephalus microplus TaxID=6941 RepID=A0A6G5A2G6_RHIMP